MSEVNPETRRILLSITEVEWRRHYRELKLYAHARCRRWLWRTGSGENLPEGFSPDAIAQEAIARLYDGTRSWNHEQYPGDNPVPYLKSVIDSIVWNLGSGAAHKHTASLGGEYAPDTSDQAWKSDEIEGADGLYQTSALAPDDKLYFEEMESRIRSAIADRQDLVDFFECLVEGLKPSEIAAKMDTSVKQIYALRKTFDRRTAEIQRELFGTKRQPEMSNKEGR